MKDTELIKILANLSQSFAPVIVLIGWIAYLLGILFIIKGILKLGEFGGSRGSRADGLGPIAYIIGGGMLLFLKSSVSVLSNSTFGAGNVLQYEAVNPYSIYDIIGSFIHLVGLVWFIRGTLLLVHATEPGEQDVFKGLTFLIAGIAAINFNNTIAVLNYIMHQLVSLTQSAKSFIGG